MSTSPIFGSPVWYGWSPVGLSGTFGEQLVAVGASLSDRTGWVEEHIVPFLRHAAGNALGFAEVASVGLVYRRTDTGLDNAGRPDAFFTEALVFERGLPVDRLVLLPAMLGRTGPPTQLPGSLPDIEVHGPVPELRATAADLAPAAVALSHLAAGQQAQPQVDSEADAWRLLCLVVSALPGPTASAAVHESPPRDRHFAINVQPGTLADRPDAAWLQAAELLLNASQTDAADRIVSALRRSTPQRTQFCRVLGAWADIELVALANGQLDAKQEAFLRREPRTLLPALAARGGWRTALAHVERDRDVEREILRFAPSDARIIPTSGNPPPGPDPDPHPGPGPGPNPDPGGLSPVLSYSVAALLILALLGAGTAALLGQGNTPVVPTTTLIGTAGTPSVSPLAAAPQAAPLVQRARRVALRRLVRAAPASVTKIHATPVNPIAAPGAFAVRVSARGDADVYRRRILDVPDVQRIDKRDTSMPGRFVFVIRLGGASSSSR